VFPSFYSLLFLPPLDTLLTIHSTLKPTPQSLSRITYTTPHSSPMALTTPKHSTKHILLITLGVKPFTLICCSLVVIPWPWGYAIWRAWRIPMNWQLWLSLKTSCTNKYSFSYWKINLVGFCVLHAFVDITRVLSVHTIHHAGSKIRVLQFTCILEIIKNTIFDCITLLLSFINNKNVFLIRKQKTLKISNICALVKQCWVSESFDPRKTLLGRDQEF
jgi:hypothetical protein